MRRISVVVMLVMFALTLLASAPAVHAIGVIQTASNSANSTTTVNKAYTTNPVAGNTLVVVAGAYQTGTPVPSISVTSTLEAGSWNLLATLGPIFQGGTSYSTAAVFSTTAVGGADTVTMTVGCTPGSCTPSAVYVYLFEVNPISGSPVVATAFTCASACGTGTATFTASSSVPVGFFNLGVAIISQTGFAGYTATSGFSGTTSNNIAIEYSTIINGVTSFPFTLAGGTTVNMAGVIGLSFGQVNTAAIQTQTVGSCPPGGGTGIGHFALANNTIYFYNANALGSEVVNTISTQVSSIKGSGTHYLELLLYASASTPPSIAFPNTRLYESKVFAISTGTTNSTITLQIGIPLNGATVTPLPFNWWSVGIVGDDHINIAGSSVSGLVTQTGTTPTGASVPPIQPSTFTSSGSASTNKLALCASATYQSVIAGIVFTTTVAAGTSTTTSVATTTIISLQGNNPAILANNNFMLAIIVILGPALLLAGATKSLLGGMFGAMLGIAVGVYIGFVPFWMVVVVVLASVMILMFGRRTSEGL